MSSLSGRRFRILAWSISCLAMLGILTWAYRRYVLLHPDPTLSWVRNGITYELLNPKMLGVALIAPWFVGVLSQSLADLPWPQRILSVLLRISFVALVALGLSRLARTATTEKACTVYLVDVSDSVPDEAIADARALIDDAWAKKPKEGIVRLITFARRPRVLEPSEKEPEKAPLINDCRARFERLGDLPFDECLLRKRVAPEINDPTGLCLDVRRL